MIPPPSVASSLPPTPADSTLTPSIFQEPSEVERAKNPSWYLPPDSKVRLVAMQIIAMRISGMEDEDIAKALHISTKSISPYVYRAAKNGWLQLDNPRDAVRYQLLHKVVKNLDEALDSTGTLQTGMKEKTAVALKMAEGTIFKEFDTVAPAQQNQTIVAIKIEMPTGEPQQIREGTLGGIPAYIDADVVPIR